MMGFSEFNSIFLPPLIGGMVGFGASSTCLVAANGMEGLSKETVEKVITVFCCVGALAGVCTGLFQSLVKKEDPLVHKVCRSAFVGFCVGTASGLVGRSLVTVAVQAPNIVVAGTFVCVILAAKKAIG